MLDYTGIPNNSGVFELVNKCNNKRYIMSSFHMRMTIRNLVSELNCNRYGNKQLLKDWNNKDTFICDVLSFNKEDKDKFVQKFCANLYNKVKFDLMYLPNKSGVYKIVNTCNHKVYIGVTKNIRKRIGLHISSCTLSKYYSGTPVKLIEDWNKFGGFNFKFEVIELTEDREREIFWILKYDSVNTGYNIRYGPYPDYAMTPYLRRKYTK